MRLIRDPFERSTAATDALIAAVALGYAAQFTRLRPHHPHRAAIWSSAFALLATAASLGVVAHGVELTRPQHRGIWRVLNLCLGLTLACFAAGAVYDTWGWRAARRALVVLILNAFGFSVLAERLDKGFVAFVAYEGVALVFALGAYSRLAALGKLPGARRISSGILLTLIAAIVQTQPRQVQFGGIALDQNSLFHFIQIAALPPLASGLRAGF
jgi:hypothetical protein